MFVCPSELTVERRYPNSIGKLESYWWRLPGSESQRRFTWLCNGVKKNQWP